MSQTCFYCQKNPAIDEEIVNPNTGEIHPTCEVCKKDFFLYRQERMRCTNTLTKGIPVMILLSVISFIFLSWKVGLSLLVIAGVVSVFANKRLNYYIKRMENETREFAKSKNLEYIG